MARASKWLKGLFQPKNPADVPLTIKLASGQTANAMEIKDSAGTVIGSIDSSGQLVQSATAAAGFGTGTMLMARAQYSFARDGGAQGLITPAAAYNTVIPDNAIILGGIINPTTAAVGASATIAIGTSAGSSATSIKGATAVTSYTLDALVATVPVFTAATAVKMTAAGSITFTVATADLTAGVIEVTLLYFVAAN
jgi:hypothetical protein